MEQQQKFDELEKIVNEAKTKSGEYRQLYIEWNSKYEEAERRLQAICKHNWVVDSSSWDHNTHRECTKCHAFR